jgi:hypothetical protein
VTQDFLLIQTPSLAVRTVDEFMTVVRTSARGPAQLLLALVKNHGLGRALGIARAAGAMKKIESMATGTFYTAAPHRWGNTAAKLALVPTAGGPARGAGKNMLRDDLVARLKDGPIVYSLRAQMFVDDKTTPIELADVVWPESKTPYVEIATLTLHRQDVLSPRGQEIEALVDKVSFDPWHSIAEHRPMGGVMRSRRPTYKASVLGRGPVDEPTSVLAPSA